MRIIPNWKKTYLVPVLTALVIVAWTQYFCSHYKLMFTFGSDKCLPGSVFLVHVGELPHAGELALFKSPKTDILPAGINIIKVVAAEAGQTITVTPFDVSNGEKTFPAPIESAAKALNINVNDLVGSREVEPEHYFMLGLLPGSYDSRFFGTISKSKVVGRAYLVI